MGNRTSLFTTSVLIGMLLMAAPTFAASSGSGSAMTMEATAYGPSAQDNYPYGATDYFGQPLRAGDIAVDPSLIPLKTCLYIAGYNSPNLPAGGYVGEADDEGGAIQGRHVDLYMNAPQSQVDNFGIQSVRVTILGPATNPSASGTAACSGYSASDSSSSVSGTNGGATTGSGATARVGSSSRAGRWSYRGGHRLGRFHHFRHFYGRWH